MIEHETQRPDTNPHYQEGNRSEKGSELVEEPDQQLQVTRLQRLQRHERIRLLILGMGLLVIMLSAVFFVFAGTIVPLFAAIVVVPLVYWCVDKYLNTSETATHVT